MQLFADWHCAHVKAISNAAHFRMPQGRQNLDMLFLASIAKQTFIDECVEAHGLTGRHLHRVV